MKDGHKVNEQLSDGCVEVHPGVFVLQLNEKRGGMQQFKELLNERSEWMNSSVVLVDTTGVSNINKRKVQYLAEIVNAFQTPGTIVLVVRRELSIDQKLANLGVNLSDITICHSLIAGLWMALDIVEPWTGSKPNKAKFPRVSARQAKVKT